MLICDFHFSKQLFHLHPTGLVYHPKHETCIVADLHLEKGSSFAKRGALLPPYDSVATLQRLRDGLAYFNPKIVVSLGDSFHDTSGALRLNQQVALLLQELQTLYEWVWVSGNHDETITGLNSKLLPSFRLHDIHLQHLPESYIERGDRCVIAGHLHPSAVISRKARRVRRRCLIFDNTQLILPSFGVYTGGLNIKDAAFSSIINEKDDIGLFLLSRERSYKIDYRDCLSDHFTPRRQAG